MINAKFLIFATRSTAGGEEDVSIQDLLKLGVDHSKEHYFLLLNNIGPVQFKALNVKKSCTHYSPVLNFLFGKIRNSMKYGSYISRQFSL